MAAEPGRARSPPRLARMYEPGAWVPRISPTPLLMIVASHDTIMLTDLALASYEQALEPKRLELIPGGHFDPYCPLGKGGAILASCLGGAFRFSQCAV